MVLGICKDADTQHVGFVRDGVAVLLQWHMHMRNARLQTSLTLAIRAPSETRMGKQCDGVRENATLLAALERARRHLAIHGTTFVLSARILPDKDAGVLRRLKAKRM